MVPIYKLAVEAAMISRDTHAFVERRYSDGEIDWVWVKKGLVTPADLDCTNMTTEELAARIEKVRSENP